MARKTKWNSGPPPSIGWWPASTRRDPNYLRWWDGEHWSCGAHYTAGVERAERVATIVVQAPTIEWRDRPASWPEWSRT